MARQWWRAVRVVAWAVLGAAAGLTWGGRTEADDAPAPGRRADQEALKAYAPLVGSWRGVGMVERGRTKGAWNESASWAWALTRDSAALEVTVAKGKHLKSGRLRPGKAPGTLAFDAVLADGTRRAFEGKPSADKKLVLTSTEPLKPDTPPSVRRVTLTPLHDTRLLALFEAEDADRPGTFTRLGEVGYTREGVAFAAGDSYPVCIVTEGRGTIPVSYKGKTYYVCCSGCRDLFNENPESVLAEAAARAKEREKK
jgi:YHS domain-containing protein